MASASKPVRFNDPLHGDLGVELPRWAMQIVDSPEFQRLRHISQLGVAKHSVNSATHSALEHALGAAGLVHRAAERLAAQTPELVDDSDVRVLVAAGLCQHLGVAPYGGAFWAAAQRVQPGGPRQEEISAALFERLAGGQAGIGLSEGEKGRVAAWLRGQADPRGRGYMFALLSAPAAGIDLPAIDRICRDAHYCGRPQSQLGIRLANSLKVVSNGERPELSWSYKAQSSIRLFFEDKESMATRVYQSREVRAMSHMVTDILCLAAGGLRLALRLRTPEGFLSLSDALLEEVECYDAAACTDNTDPAGMCSAQALLTRLHGSRLYQCVGEVAVPAGSGGPAGITPEAVAAASGTAGDGLCAGDLLVDHATLEWSTESAALNPLNGLPFHFQGDDSSECRRARFTSLVPETPYLQMVRLYVKPDDATEAAMDAAFTAFSALCDQRLHKAALRIAYVPASLRKIVDATEPPVFKDLIHGDFTLPAEYLPVVRHAYYQRMRGIKQLGTVSHVWYGGAHTRYDHSLGVGCLAHRAVMHLRDVTARMGRPEVAVTNEDVAVVTLAGLCHDLGHGPFSHMFESVARQALQEAEAGSDAAPAFQHEDMSVAVMGAILEDVDPLAEAFPAWVRTRAAAAIRGEALPDDPKAFLVHLVSNAANGLDVDKLDYLVRDAAYTNVRQLSASAFCGGVIDAMRVCWADEGWQLSWPANKAEDIAAIYKQRAHMHRLCYTDHRSKAVELMVHEAIVAASSALGLAGKLRNPRRFATLRDSVLTRIEHWRGGHLAPRDAQGLRRAQALVARVRRRDIYKFVASTPVPPGMHAHLGPNLEHDLLQHVDAAAGVTANDITVVHKRLDWTKKERNPLHAVTFHRQTPDGAIVKVDQPDLSIILPDCFMEREVQLYLKNTAGGEAAVQMRYTALNAAFRAWQASWLAQEGAIATPCYTPRSKLRGEKRSRDGETEDDGAATRRTLAFP